MSTDNETVLDAEPNSAEVNDRLLSLSWNNGILGAVYYDLATMELTLGNSFISQDFRAFI